MNCYVYSIRGAYNIQMNGYDKTKLYKTDEYVNIFPTLFEEDSEWKLSKIIPLTDEWIAQISGNIKIINLLDVGGGAGLILRSVSSHIEKKYDKKVNKYALDLSGAALEMQQKRNPDLKKVLNEDIADTSLKNKEIDLTLLIDVLEHLAEPDKALKEIKRISRFVILKVPLEDNIVTNLSNLINSGQTKRELAEKLGHVNLYNYRTLRKQIQEQLGGILKFSFTNAFELYLSSEMRRKDMKLTHKLANIVCAHLFNVSEVLASRIFDDFAVLLVKC